MNYSWSKTDAKIELQKKDEYIYFYVIREQLPSQSSNSMYTIQSSCAQIPKDGLEVLVQIRRTSSSHITCPKQLQEFQLPEPIASKI